MQSVKYKSVLCFETFLSMTPANEIIFNLTSHNFQGFLLHLLHFAKVLKTEQC